MKNEHVERLYALIKDFKLDELFDKNIGYFTKMHQGYKADSENDVMIVFMRKAKEELNADEKYDWKEFVHISLKMMGGTVRESEVALDNFYCIWQEMKRLDAFCEKLK